VIRWIMRTVAALFVYLCVGTVLAEVIVATVLANHWKLDRGRLIQILAIAQGLDLFAMRDEAEQQADEASYEQVSYEEVLAVRAEQSLNIQLREQALAEELDVANRLQRDNTTEMKRIRQISEAFRTEVTALDKEQIEGGIATERAYIEKLKKGEAKQYVGAMLDDGKIDAVIMLLRGMEDKKAADIIKEFITAGEVDKILEVLTKIREGDPGSAIVEDALRQLDEADGATP